MRYLLRLSYDGSSYAGWQRQENAYTVQQAIEESISTKLQSEIQVVGCGRTDSGVHASDFLLHFDHNAEMPQDFLYAVNQMLPSTIAIHSCEVGRGDFHARFDATKRSYEYKIHSRKDPFIKDHSFYFQAIKQADLGQMQGLADLLLDYDDFKPFCKVHTDVKTMRCKLSESNWSVDERGDHFTFRISSDRFLRGMVRLIVGACIQCGLGQINYDEVKEAMDQQSKLPKPWSVPAMGLFLSKVEY